MVEAHAEFQNYSSAKCPFFKRATATNEELPEFMLRAQEPRVEWLRVKDRSTVSFHQTVESISRANASMKEVKERYGIDATTSAPLKGAVTFRDQCIFWFNHSKRLFEADGYLIPTALIKTEKSFQIFQIGMRDRADKHAAIREIADSCKRLNGTAIVLINEAWVAPAEFAATGKHAIDSLERKEAVILHGLKRDGEAVHCFNVFRRQGKRILFGEDAIQEGGIPNIMAPFAKIWNLYVTPS